LCVAIDPHHRLARSFGYVPCIVNQGGVKDDFALKMATERASAGGGADFTVMIVASGPVRGGGLVHAVVVTQPLQSWSVLRSHEDFYALSDVLLQLLNGPPACPVITDLHQELVSLAHIVSTRNKLQEWLSKVLIFPGASETAAVRNFLTFGANTILPQFEGVSWTSFTPDGGVLSPEQVPTSAAASSNTDLDNLDDMEMDVMFGSDDDEGDLQDESDDDEEYIRPSIRYKPTDEPVTEEDKIDLMEMAGEVEMIEDIGSFAQSLGASHLGRSLQLQAESAAKNSYAPAPVSEATKPAQGLTIGAATTGSTSSGGIGSAMEQAKISGFTGIGENFSHKPAETAPRVDSFKMIKVIGKGSFGKVFLVRENHTGDMYALKVLRKDNIIKRNQVEHTRTERSVLGYVKHPFIVGKVVVLKGSLSLQRMRHTAGDRLKNALISTVTCPISG